MSSPSLRAYTLAVVVLVLVSLSSCRSIPRIAAKGQFTTETLDTTVDSELAQYYLENYLPGKKARDDLDTRLDTLYQQYSHGLPSRDQLALISRETSVDVAALFFADRLLHDGCNRELNQRYAAYLDAGEVAAVKGGSYLILFVPGWDYVENGHLTGADFARPRHLVTQFGIENHLVELPATGSVEENATAIAAAIAKYRTQGTSILLVGASSAGPAIHLALAELVPVHELASIKAWLNLGGILQGSPLVDYLQVWPRSWLLGLVSWWKGWSKDAINGMAVEPSRKRFGRLKLRHELLVINYVGIPLSGSLSKYGSDKYPLLKPEGPNDGLTLVRDVLAPDSHTIVALGRDHFFAEDPRIDQKTMALMQLVMAYLENDTIANCR